MLCRHNYVADFSKVLMMSRICWLILTGVSLLFLIFGKREKKTMVANVVLLLKSGACIIERGCKGIR